MSVITFNILIKAPILHVWSYLDDPDKMPLWMEGLVEMTYPNGRPSQRATDHDRKMGVGTKFRQTIKEGARVKGYDGHITHYDPPHLLGLRLDDDAFSMDISYRLSSANSGSGPQTKLAYSCETATHSRLAIVLGFVFRPLTRHIAKTHMRKLVAVCEAA